MADAIGIDFIFRADDGGFPQSAEDVELVAAAAKQILLTEIGERRHRPFFGARLRSYLFENIDNVTLEALRGEVEQALERNLEDDIVIVAIDATADEDDLGDNPTRVSVSLEFDRGGRRGEVTIVLSA